MLGKAGEVQDKRGTQLRLLTEVLPNVGIKVIRKIGQIRRISRRWGFWVEEKESIGAIIRNMTPKIQNLSVRGTFRHFKLSLMPVISRLKARDLKATARPHWLDLQPRLRWGILSWKIINKLPLPRVIRVKRTKMP